MVTLWRFYATIPIHVLWKYKLVSHIKVTGILPLLHFRKIRSLSFHISPMSSSVTTLFRSVASLGAGGIMFSGCPFVRPSIRPKPEIPSFHLYVSSLVHPTNRDRFAACPSFCPSVRLERFPGICRRTHAGGDGLKCCMLMYLGHLQNWLDYGHGLLIFLLLRHVDLIKRVKFGVSGTVAWYRCTTPVLFCGHRRSPPLLEI